MAGLENDTKEMFIIRRRVEGSDGRVGKCSGETEVMYQGCQDKECSG